MASVFSRRLSSWRATTKPAISTAPMITVRCREDMSWALTLITRTAVAVTATNGSRLNSERPAVPGTGAGVPGARRCSHAAHAMETPPSASRPQSAPAISRVLPAASTSGATVSTRSEAGWTALSGAAAALPITTSSRTPPTPTTAAATRATREVPGGARSRTTYQKISALATATVAPSSRARIQPSAVRSPNGRRMNATIRIPMPISIGRPT